MVKRVFTYSKRSLKWTEIVKDLKERGHRVGSGSKAATSTVAIRTFLGDVSWSGQTSACCESSSRRQNCGEINP